MTSPDDKLAASTAALTVDESMPQTAQENANSKPSGVQNPDDAGVDSFAPELPPFLADTGEKKSIDEQLKELQSHPMFMTSLPDEPNELVEALQALAYEGTRAEVAANFREQGNESFKAGDWRNAAEFYTKAVDHLLGKDEAGKQAEKEKNVEPEEKQDLPEIELPELENTEPKLSPEEEAKVERSHLLACLLNRSLCNLRLKNFRSASLDGRQALVLDPTSLKGHYRIALAHYNLSDPNGPSATPYDHFKIAGETTERGLKIHPGDKDLVGLSDKLRAREKQLSEIAQKKIREQQQKFSKSAVLKTALKRRGWVVAESSQRHGGPDLEDAEISLEDPRDPQSELSLPVLVLYPLSAQSDFLKQVPESAKIAEILGTVLDEQPAWDAAGEYHPDATACYAESAKGGMLKLGNKVKLETALADGKVVLTDGMMTLHAVPKIRVEGWLEEMRRRRQ